MNLSNDNQEPRMAQRGTLPDEDHILNLSGFIRTIDFVPTAKPKAFLDQFFIVTAGASSRFYMYDTNPGTLGWKYTTLT